MLNRSSKNLTTEQEAYDYALDILSYRDYSRKDMELKLKRKGADAVIIKSTIQKLLEYGFLDEKRYGQRVFEAWLSKKYYGRCHLRLELQKKNVAERYINDILAQFSEAEEQERAELRREYVAQFRANLTAQLENTYIVDENGKRTKLRKKGTP